MAVETEVVPIVVAMDINVDVVMDEYITTGGELVAGFNAPLRLGANHGRTLDNVRIKMAHGTVGWTFHNCRACRPQGWACWIQGRPGRGERWAWAARRTAAAKPAGAASAAVF